MGRLVPEKKIFFKVFTIYGHGGPLGNVTRTIWTNFCSPIPWRRHMEIGFNRLAVSEEKMFKECGRLTDGQTDDGRRRPAYPISSQMSLRLRWAKTAFQIYVRTLCFMFSEITNEIWNVLATTQNSHLHQKLWQGLITHRLLLQSNRWNIGRSRQLLKATFLFFSVFICTSILTRLVMS